MFLDMENKIVWIQGEQGTGKTALSNFLQVEYLGIYATLIDIESKEDRLTAFKIIDEILTNKEKRFKLLIFSQEPPPELINGIEFKPLHIIISRPLKMTLERFCIEHFEETESWIDLKNTDNLIDYFFEKEPSFVSLTRHEILGFLMKNYTQCRYREMYSTKVKYGFCLNFKK